MTMIKVLELPIYGTLQAHTLQPAQVTAMRAHEVRLLRD